MTETQDPTPTGPPAGGSAGAAGGRYSRSFGGLVGAMIVIVVAVLAFAAVKALLGDDEATPVQVVDYSGQVTAARADQQLQILVPDPLPSGWKATSAAYIPGASPSWHLGMLTDQGKYVGIEEGRSSIADLASEHVDVNAERGKDVTIDGQTWQTWTDSGGDYAVARSSGSGAKPVEAWLVVGTAPEATIRKLAASLSNN
ncbi:MAG: hypothetical protein JWR90_2718 [Marmoricola sp.]|jgi:hypothetical protein|nr:hypothetical protein [Marmoricola sp.]